MKRGGPRADRVAGAVLAVTALGATALALAFHVVFAADPLGPRALPLLAAALLAAGGLALALRPEAPWSLPGPAAVRRIAAATGAFLLYVPLLPWIGFVAATTLFVAALGRLFGGAWPRALASGLVVAVTLQLLFASGLGLLLPVGSLWTAGP